MASYTVAAHEAKVDATFSRVAGIDDAQVQADFARYLCVVASGFLEQAVRHTYGAYAQSRGHPNVARYVEARLSGFTNANCERLLGLAAGFQTTWRTQLEQYLVDERKDAIDSLIANRHQIAHGRDVGITYIRISTYYAHVKDAVHFIEQLTA